MPLGARGERAAAWFLRRRGYRVLARNARLSVGEADIVCLAPDGRTIVVVEVKTRRRHPQRPVAPEVNITAHKRRKLRQVAAMLARRNGWHQRPLRIDVIAVEYPAGGGTPQIRHHKGAVQGGATP